MNRQTQNPRKAGTVIGAWAGVLLVDRKHAKGKGWQLTWPRRGDLVLGGGALVAARWPGGLVGWLGNP